MDGPHDHSDDRLRRDALAWAAAFRDRRSELRSQLADGSTTLGEVLERAERSDDGALKLLFVLESLPGAGKVSTRRRLAELGLDETTPLRRLTPEERRSVLGAFPLDGDVAPGGRERAS